MNNFNCNFFTLAGAPVVYFDQDSYSVSEDSDNVTLTLITNVPGGPPQGSVVLYTEDSSATGQFQLKY